MIFICAIVLCSILHLERAQLQSNGDVRLSQGYRGRVEIFLNGSWGSLCNDGFGINEAEVVCHQLGYTGATSYGLATRLGYKVGFVSQRIWLDSVTCNSNELHILNCVHTPIGDHDCSHIEDVAVECSLDRIWSQPYAGQVRLIGGKYISVGRVEIYCNGEWGTVCNDFFDKNEADTVCRQLGYSRASEYRFILNDLPQGNVSQPIWLDDVRCSHSGQEICLTQCRQCPSVQQHNCKHSEDINVACTHDGISSMYISNNETDCQFVTIDERTVVGVVIGVVIICCCGCCLVVFGAAILMCLKKKQNKKSPPTIVLTPSSPPRMAGTPTSPFSPSAPRPPPRPLDTLYVYTPERFALAPPPPPPYSAQKQIYVLPSSDDEPIEELKDDPQNHIYSECGPPLEMYSNII